MQVFISYWWLESVFTWVEWVWVESEPLWVESSMSHKIFNVTRVDFESEKCDLSLSRVESMSRVITALADTPYCTQKWTSIKVCCRVDVWRRSDVVVVVRNFIPQCVFNQKHRNSEAMKISTMSLASSWRCISRHDALQPPEKCVPSQAAIV